jgi:hypothetical protein
MTQTWQDPLDYISQWAKALPVEAVDPSETSYLVTSIISHASLLYDYPGLAGKTKRSQYSFVRRALKRYDADIARMGIIDTISWYKKCAMSFLRCFKTTKEGRSFSIPEQLLDTPVSDAMKLLHMEFLNTGQVSHETQRWILTWLLFLSKLPTNRPDLVETDTKSWIARQEGVKALEDPPQSLVLALRYIVAWLLNIEDVSSCGKHGPGTTAEGAKTIQEKNRLWVPTLQTLLLCPTSPVDDIRLPIAKPNPNKFMLVPKDNGSLRPITAESIAMQYAQQSLKRKWYKSIDFPTKGLEAPISKFVKFSDQSRAQALALRGSFVRHKKQDAKPGTIDLSAASDWLSVNLVTSVFKGDLLHKIMCGRSWETVVDFWEGLPYKNHDVVELGMYAGMGSALTFPIQTTIFTAIAVWSTLVALHKKELGIAPQDLHVALNDYLDQYGFKPKYKAYSKSIQVYGDDIIVPELAVTEMIQMLESLGLKVNQDKSFFKDDAVRESCGIFACWGKDITPVRYRIPPWKNSGSLDYASLEGARSLTNFAYHHGYRMLYRSLIKIIKTHPLHINGDETRRTSSRTIFEEYRIKNSRGKMTKVKRYPRQHLGDATFLFEEYRGDDDYLGFISNRPSEATHTIQVHESVKALTTWAMATKSDTDDESDYYDLQQHLYRKNILLSREDETNQSSATEVYLSRNGFAVKLHKQSHGKVSRGVRLIKSNVIPAKIYFRGYSTMAWRLAPK